MSEFMMLMRGDDSAQISPETMQERLGRYREWMMAMQSEGKLRAGQPLESSGRLVVDRDTILTDGPFLEPKEIIAGYIIINAENIDDATEIARGCPLLDHCEILVRPLIDMPG